MKLGKTVSECEVLPGYGKRQLMTYADGFLSLARLFERDAGTYDAQEDGGTETADLVEERSNLILRQCMLQNRSLMAEHLREMAQIMEQVAKQSFQSMPLLDRDRRQILRALKEHGIQVKEIYLFEAGENRLKVGLTMRAVRTEVFTVEEIGDFLSVLFDRHLAPEKNSIFFLKQEYETVMFEESACYEVMTGMARAVKENETVSGDNYSFQEIGNGHYLVALSDGMGSGVKACRDSELVIELLEKYMDNGFSREMAVEMINGALLSRQEEENMSTLDLCDIDLYEGTAEVLKIGAACTYKKTSEGVEMLPSATLPLGTLLSGSGCGDVRFTEAPKEGNRYIWAAEAPDMEHYFCDMKNGESLIMVSDGVIESIRGEHKEQTLRDIVGMLSTKSMRELANNILQYALHQSEGRIRDDMTVLTFCLMEREK